MQRAIKILVVYLLSNVLASEINAQDLPARSFPLDIEENNAAEGEILLRPLDAEIAALADLVAVDLGPVVLPDGSEHILSLRRINPRDFRIATYVNGAPAPDALESLALSVWIGKILNFPDSSVFLSLSRFGSRGWIQRGTDRFDLITRIGADRDWTRCRSVWTNEDVLAHRGQRLGRICTLDTSAVGPFTTVSPLPSGGALTLTGGLDCSVAIEGDHQLFDLFGNIDAAFCYVVPLILAVSSRYTEQLGVTLTFPYVNIWASANDPWDAQDNVQPDVDYTLPVLNEFSSAWLGIIPNGARLAHLMSGADLGGGRAVVGALCNPGGGFGVSGNIDGRVRLPIAPGPMTWDFVVVAHEIGHNFGAVHTHDTCPPLDSCAPGTAEAPFGQCQTSQECITNGTLMSYCHQCDGGTSNITTYFHTQQIGGMVGQALSCGLPAYCAGPSLVYVDRANIGLADGTQQHPYRTVGAGVLHAGNCGAEIRIQAGHYDEGTLVIKNPTLSAIGGEVLIGQP